MRNSCCATCAGALAIVGVATIIGAAHSMVTPVHLKRAARPVDTEPAEDPGGIDQTVEIGTATTEAETPEQVFKDGEIGLARAKELHDEFVVFLDARPLYQYEQGHIPEALWMPVERVRENGSLIWDLETEAGGFDQPIVIYCGGGECDASHNLAIILEQGGFTNLLIFVEGYPAWVEGGLNTQVGAPLEIEP